MIRNVKKNVASATKTIVDIIVISITIESKDKVVKIVPTIPVSKQPIFFLKHSESLEHAPLHELNASALKINISAKAATPKAIHKPVVITGINPLAKSIPTIIPKIIPNITLVVVHPLHTQLLLLVIFIFIISR